MKFLIKEHINNFLRKSKSYLYFRKLRMLLYYKPSYHKTKDFFKYYILGLYNRIDEHHDFLLAGGLAFSLVIGIIPFALIITAILGNILDSFSIHIQVKTFIETVIPYEKYSEFVKDIIFTRIDELIEYKNIAGIIGIFGLLFAASGLFSSMRTILNKIMGIEVNIHFIIAKLRDFLFVIFVIIIFFVTTFVIPALEIAKKIATNSPPSWLLNSVFFEHVLFSVMSFIIMYIIFNTLYLTVPFKKLGKKATFVGAFWAALLWEIAKQIFGYYIHNFTTFGKIYGTYAFIFIIAIWVYYSSVVFIIGAEISRLFHEKHYINEEFL